MGAFKLGKMTFGSLFKKPETVMYPLEKKPQPAGLKGHIALDEATCILCGMCDRSCATNCITVDKKARTWTIDRLQCIQCGYCITVCPKKCLHMDPNYAPATTVHAADTVIVPEQEKPAAKKPEDGKDVSKSAEKETTQPSAQTHPEPSSDTDASFEKRDKQLETLIGLMDAEKAERVKSALG